MSESTRRLEADCERYEVALERVLTWATAYSLKVFPEPDLVRVREVLEAHGLSLDAVSASAMRHVVTGVGDIARQALKRGTQ